MKTATATLVELAERMPDRVSFVEEAPAVDVRLADDPSAYAVRYRADPVRLWTLRDVQVHMLHGAVITVDDVVVSDVDVPARDPFDGGSPVMVRLERAVHAAWPFVGNYYHFVFGTVVRCFGIDEHLPRARRAPIILPRETSAHHAWAGAWLAAIYAGGTYNVAATYHVGELLLRSDCGGSHGATPIHPFVGRLRDRLRDALPPGVATRLYVTRASAPARRCTNEYALTAALRERGYFDVDFADVPVSAQLRATGGARTVVALHGAGLANLVACAPGTRVLEIRPSHCRAPMFKHLSAALDLRYTALDVEVPGAADQFAPWTVDVGAVLRVLDASGAR